MWRFDIWKAGVESEYCVTCSRWLGYTPLSLCLLRAGFLLNPVCLGMDMMTGGCGWGGLDGAKDVGSGDVTGAGYWYTPLIQVLGRWRKVHLWVWGKPHLPNKSRIGLHWKIPCLKNMTWGQRDGLMVERACYAILAPRQWAPRTCLLS